VVPNIGPPHAHALKVSEGCGNRFQGHMGTLRIILDDTMEVSLLVEFCPSDVMFGH
jgi:hypothetical protein